MLGSRVGGENVALVASHDLNLMSQTEQHALKNSNKSVYCAAQGASRTATPA